MQIRARIEGFIARAPVMLAWRNATSDRRRLYRAAAGIGLAAVLILVQLGFREAFLESALTIFRAIDGELVILSTTRYQLGQRETFPRQRIYQALAVPAVRSASPMYFEWSHSRWRSPIEDRAYLIRVVAFDPGNPALKLEGLTENRVALTQTGNALMDRRGRRFLGEIAPGLVSELNGRGIRVVATFPMGPDFTVDGTLLMSERNYLTYFGESASGGADKLRAQVDYGIVKLRAGADPGKAKAALRDLLPRDVDVLTRDELIALEAAFQDSVTPVGPIFGLGALIGLCVGMLIAYQILFTEISDRRAQFATLKAIGYPPRYILGVIVRQSLLYGIAGFVPALLASWLAFAAIDRGFLIPMRISPAIFAATFVMVLIICIVAGLIAARRAVTADPAEVF
jgi:putative ABC transport system permease protein